MSRVVLIMYATFISIAILMSQLYFLRSKGALALSMSTSTTASRGNLVVAAYGDSLTAGTSDQGLFPYAPHLQQIIPNSQVFHRGLPGWTSEQMLVNPNDPLTGLRSFLQYVTLKSQIQSIDICLIMVGTNDIGYRYSAETILGNVQRLHSFCHERSIPTLAIAIPPSRFLQQVSWAQNVQQQVNKGLEAWSKESPLVFYTPFPFEFDNGANWSSDGLHFSPIGYRVLGEQLAPIVLGALSRDGSSRGS